MGPLTLPAACVPIVVQYRVLVERSRNLGRASDALDEAANARNLPALQQAISVRLIRPPPTV
jgi:hypothetical protein